ncbi:MAG: VWA domain-containing protein [Alphaproteobacteria bacterium]|nr:VWA domain-containing protein [Alphaproteobacteria bacterium]MCY4230535.1 VWA domain-containing protein [Alphaproteobacteria bacterium]
MIEFERFWAFALLPLPLGAWLLLAPLPARRALRIPTGVWRHLGALSGTQGGGRIARGAVPRGLGWLALVTALAGPFSEAAPLLKPSGRDVMVAIDLSASMAEQMKGQDGAPVRQADIVRQMLRDFIVSRQGDRIGLIGFASEAYLVVPLGFDTQAAAAVLDELGIGLPGRRTDIGQAIGLAVQAFRREPAGQKVLLIVSDGEANAGSIAAIDAARIAAADGIVMHIVGFADRIDKSNSEFLRTIAAETGGRYFEAVSATALDAAHQAIGDLVPANRKVSPLTRDWSWAPLALALAALAWIVWLEGRDP